MSIVVHSVNRHCACPLLLQNEGTLLHCTAVDGSVELFEWLMANYKFDVEAKEKVLLCPHMLH